MNKLSLISLSLLSISLVACGKESDFKKAINAKISQQPACLSLNSDDVSYLSGVSDDERNRLKEKTKNAYVVEQGFDKDGKNSAWDSTQKIQAEKLAKFDALVSAGLLVKSSESVPKYNYSKQPDGNYTLSIYTMTDAGNATKFVTKPNEVSKSLFGDSGQRIFCYAYPEVAKIENYTEGDAALGGVHYAEVKYSYTYTNIADWATKPEIKEVFPEISKHLDNPDKTNKMDIIKTNNGWSTDL